MTETASLLVDTYQRWYAQALAVLPDDLKDRFRGEYEGSTWTTKIKGFLEAPRATNAEAQALFSTPDGPTLPIGHWRSPVETTFIAPLQAQVAMLREAEARAPEPVSDDREASEALTALLRRIGRLARELAVRREGRPPFEIDDEYDLQTLVRGVLRATFDDVRSEDPLPIRAGASSRVDFVVPEIATMIELKFVKQRGKDKSIGDELLIDIGRYQSGAPSYGRLVALIYDPDRLLDNPRGLEADLTGDREGLEVVAIVAH
jgi:hypothetical protein